MYITRKRCSWRVAEVAFGRRLGRSYFATLCVRLDPASGALLLVPESIVFSFIRFSCRRLRSSLRFRETVNGICGDYTKRLVVRGRRPNRATEVNELSIFRNCRVRPYGTLQRDNSNTVRKYSFFSKFSVVTFPNPFCVNERMR